MTGVPTQSDAFDDKVFLYLVLGVSLAFVWILRPYAGAILWATVLAIVFAGVNRHLRERMRQRRTTAAATTLVIIVVLVLFPVALIVESLIDEGTTVYRRIQSGELDVGAWFRQLYAALPGWAVDLLNRFGLTNLETVQARLSGFLARGAQLIATQALSIGQNTFQFVVALFVMLYLLFFLLRDGDVLSRRIRDAIPMHPERQRSLAGRFTTVIRATIKGNLVVALVQGALGWLIFWILGVGAPVLLGVLIALLSLLPAVGAPVVWVPIAIYLFATGQTWQAITLAVFGALVIGSADNILRPILVGKDTKLPDYVVLISTLGGLAVFGANGFVIGPVIAALFVTVWEIFVASRKTGIADNQPVIAGNQPVIPSEARDLAGLQAMPEQDPSLRSG
ncbi:MAG TPA: AI-2E family transporter [Gemmatimonadales bacterium]|nr:AI-2E family transporter [Gemmatimonadales bacterium]